MVTDIVIPTKKGVIMRHFKPVEVIMKIQQGDVILKLVANKAVDLPGHYKLIRDKTLTLRKGEATGHHHRFEYGSAVRLYGYSSYSKLPDVVEVKSDFATLYHEEHNPVEVPRGFWRVSQVREFDHLSATTRRVLD